MPRRSDDRRPLEWIEKTEVADVTRLVRPRRISRRGWMVLGVAVAVSLVIAGVVIESDVDNGESGPDRQVDDDADAADAPVDERADVATLEHDLGRVALSVEPPSAAWSGGPIERLSDGGFRSGSLYISRSTRGSQGAEAIVLWSAVPNGGDLEACAYLGALPPDVSVDELVAAVSFAPGIEVRSGPADVMVGGWPATRVGLTVAEDLGCDPGYFFEWQDEGWGSAWGATEVFDSITVWIVDVDGTPVLIEAEEKPNAGTSQEIQRVVESIRFG